MEIYRCMCKYTVHTSVIQRCFSHLPLGKMAAVYPERPPSDMTSSALQWEEQRPPQKLPLTLWHCWASSLPVHQGCWSRSPNGHGCTTLLLPLTAGRSPRGQVMSWHGCPVSELVPGLPLTCPPYSSSSFSSMEKREQTVRMGHWGCQLVPAARGDIQGGGHLS